MSERLRGLRGLRRLKGSFGPLEKKDLARQSPEPTACVLLAVACSTMLCFVGTTPSPAAGSTPLKQSLRAPAVQMEARGGGEGALGDMSPDTYIIGITVLCVASLFANISGFFNP